MVLLQRGIGYSALASGAAGLPVTILLLLLSPRMGGLVIRVGARPLLTIGAVGVGAGFLLMLRIKPGATYWFGVFPGMVVFALGLAFVVTPITTTALRDIPMDRNGIASGVNNATARVGSLIAVAVLPLASGIASTSTSDVANLINGVHRALVIAAASCFVAAAVAWFALPRQSAPTEAKTADVMPAPPSMGPAVEPESRQAQARGG